MAYIVVSGAPDFWNVTWDVHPNPRVVTTDVMLVQALLVAYFMRPTDGGRPGLKAKAMTIISRFGKRFDDGIYGESTRQLMTLFEEDFGSPVRDGIVRKVPNIDAIGGPETKLKRLNFMWNMTMLGGALGDTKKETAQRALQPVLYRELYRNHLYHDAE